MHDCHHLQSILKSHHEEHITDTHTPGWKDKRLSETNADLEGDVAFWARVSACQGELQPSSVLPRELPSR